MKKIGIIGAGTMGNGIAHVAAMSGFDTVLLDIKDHFLKIGFDNIYKNMERQLNKGEISKFDMENSLGRILTTTDFSTLSDCDLIIEAVNEDLEIKSKIFQNLNNICKSQAILASNTSSISITKIASSTNRPEKVIGMHFMNPVPVMKLVEIVNGKKTANDTTNEVFQLSRKMGKVPVKCNDSPGFISNRILMPMINEAIFCLYEDVGTPKDIDSIMQLGMAHPMGPLKLADLIGLDICLNIINILYLDFGDEKYKPCPLLVKMVEKGELGRKTRKGFYSYNTK